MTTTEKIIGGVIIAGASLIGATLDILPAEPQLTFDEYFEYLVVKDALIKEAGGIELKNVSNLTDEQITEKIEEEISNIEPTNKTFVVGEDEYTLDELKAKNTEYKEKLKDSKESLLEQVIN